MSKHIDAMFRPEDEIALNDAEFLAAHGLDADAPIEAVIEANTLATLQMVASSTAQRYSR